MKKKIISLLMIGVVSLGLIGCAGVDTVNENTTSNVSGRFINTGDCYDIGCKYYVCYDSKTKIVYLVARNLQSSGITVMYDNQGKPMTIDEYNKTK